MKKRFAKGVLYAFCILGIMALPLSASATNMPITNHSFENPVLPDGTWTPKTGYLTLPGWTITGGSAGVFNPASNIGDNFLAGVDGQNVAWSNNGDIQQGLGVNLTEGYRYTLRVKVGGYGAYFGKPYAVILVGDSQEIESVTGFNSQNAWIEQTLTYTSPQGDSNAGQPLTIKLMNYDGTQVNFDKVTLDASLVLTCQGFLPPFDKPLSLKAKDNRAIPVKMVLRDLSGNIITDANITAPPVVNVFFGDAPASQDPGYVADLVPSGLSDDGNEFRYDPVAQVWIINLATKQFKSPGTYNVTAVAGDDSYVIDGCSQTFTRQ